MRLKENPGKKAYLLNQTFFMPDGTSTAAKQQYEKWEKRICEIFIQALATHDRVTIIESANAAHFLKDKLDSDFAAADVKRQKLLRLKMGSLVMSDPRNSSIPEWRKTS